MKIVCFYCDNIMFEDFTFCKVCSEQNPILAFVLNNKEYFIYTNLTECEVYDRLFKGKALYTFNANNLKELNSYINNLVFI
jgi:hypothetical protein